MTERNDWFDVEYERAKRRMALIPPHARMVVTASAPHFLRAALTEAGDE